MKIIAPLLIIFLSAHAHAQQQFDSDGMLKLEKATRQKKTGVALTAAGGVLLGVGLIVGLNSSETTTYNNGAVTQSSSTGNLGLAQTSLLLGLAGLGAGIPIWSVGAHRVKKLNSQGVSLSFSPHVNGMTLRLRF